MIHFYLRFLMIVYYFHVKKIFENISKTNAKLTINPDTVLSFSITVQRFQLISRRNS